MTKRLLRRLLSIAIVMTIVLATMTTTASAASLKKQSTTRGDESHWYFILGTTYNYFDGMVTNIDPLKENGIDFICTGYDDKGYSGLKAICELHPDFAYLGRSGSAVELDRVSTDSKTLKFIYGWQKYNVYDVGYHIQGVAAVTGQAMEGRAY